MACGDWLIKEITSKYVILENHKCYGIILSKKFYDESFIEYIRVILE